MSPALVGADAEHGQIDARERIEGVGGGGVAGEEHSALPMLDEVGVVSAPAVEGVAGAPVIGFEGGDLDIAEAHGSAPGEFDDAPESGGDEAARAAGRDDSGARVREGFEGGEVEVVEVCVGEQEHVDAPEGPCIGGGVAEARGAEGSTGEARADAVGEDGVGEDGGLSDADERGGVAEPDGLERVDRCGTQRERVGCTRTNRGRLARFAKRLRDLSRITTQLRADGAGSVLNASSKTAPHSIPPCIWTAS